MTQKTDLVLDVFNMRCLQDILGVLWRDHMSNVKMLQRVTCRTLWCRRFIRHLRTFWHQEQSLDSEAEVKEEADQRRHG